MCVAVTQEVRDIIENNEKVFLLVSESENYNICEKNLQGGTVYFKKRLIILQT